MNEMIKNTCTALLIFGLLVLCPLGAAFSQEPSEPKEENTLGDGLKAVQEAEGRLDPEPDTQVTDGTQANEQADNNNEGAQVSGEGENNIEAQGLDTLDTADQANESALPRGDALRAEPLKPRYDSTGMRDPFQPFIKLVDIPTGPDPILRPPLRRYPLNSFRLAGIIWIGDEPKAMIVDPEANTYFLGVGDKIGNKEGEILEVREQGILVQEQTRFENVYGEVKTEVKKSVLAFQN